MIYDNHQTSETVVQHFSVLETFLETKSWSRLCEEVTDLAKF